MAVSSAEFTLPRRRASDRRSPVRWIISHGAHQWFFLLVMLGGALLNAALAGVVPVLIGQVFNDISKTPPDTSNILRAALLVAGSQVLRAILQLARNFGAEMTAQRVERDIRDELYISLLGKSMTFHNLQPVGDTMARATNDVREINFMFSPGVNLVVGASLFMIIPWFIVPSYH